jgi:hypothetical protein
LQSASTHSTSVNALQYNYQNNAVEGFSGPDPARDHLLLAMVMPVAV